MVFTGGLTCSCMAVRSLVTVSVSCFWADMINGITIGESVDGTTACVASINVAILTSATVKLWAWVRLVTSSVEATLISDTVSNCEYSSVSVFNVGVVLRSATVKVEAWVKAGLSSVGAVLRSATVKVIATDSVGASRVGVVLTSATTKLFACVKLGVSSVGVVPTLATVKVLAWVSAGASSVGVVAISATTKFVLLEAV